MRERGNKNGIVIISIPIVGVDEGGRGEGERGDRDKDKDWLSRSVGMQEMHRSGKELP